MGQIVTVTQTLTTVGSNGAATDTDVTDVLHGWLLDISLDWHASAPATSDITIRQTDRTENLLAISNSATDAQVAPRDAPVTRANAAITNAYDRIPLNGSITTVVAESNPLTACCTVKIRYEAL